MRKLFSMFVTLLLIISAIPTISVLAEDDGTRDDTTISNDDNSSNDEYDDDKESDYADDDSQNKKRIELREELRIRDDGRIEHRQETRTRDAEGNEVKTELRERIDGRALPPPPRNPELRDTRLDDRREQNEHSAIRVRFEERIKNAKEHYEQARERYIVVRDNVADARERLQECRDDKSTDCKEVREEIRQNAKPFLGQSAEMVLEALNKLASRVSESTNLSEEEKEERLIEIEERIQTVELAIASVKGLGDAATQEEIREAASIIKEVWNDSKKVIKKQTTKMTHDKIRHAYQQLDKLGERIEQAINKLDEAGKDVAKVKELLNEFNTHLDSAKDKFTQAMNLFETARESEKTDEIIAEANGYLREAHSELLEARKILRTIIGELRELNNGDLSIVEEIKQEESTQQEESQENNINTQNNNDEVQI